MRNRFFVVALATMLIGCGQATPTPIPATLEPTTPPESATATEAAVPPTSEPTPESAADEPTSQPPPESAASEANATPAESDAPSEANATLEEAGIPAPTNGTAYELGTNPIRDALIEEVGALPSTFLGSQNVTQAATAVYISQDSLDDLQTFYNRQLTDPNWGVYKVESSNTQVLLGYQYAGFGPYDLAQVVILADPNAAKGQKQTMVVISIGTAD